MTGGGLFFIYICFYTEKRPVQSNSLPYSEVIKAGVLLTDDECYAIALQLLSDGGLNSTRNAMIIAINLVSVARTGEVTQALLKDRRHLTFQCGTSLRRPHSGGPRHCSGLH